MLREGIEPDARTTRHATAAPSGPSVRPAGVAGMGVVTRTELTNGTCRPRRNRFAVHRPRLSWPKSAESMLPSGGEVPVGRRWRDTLVGLGRTSVAALEDPVEWLGTLPPSQTKACLSGFTESQGT
jgi:hypothetical protein